MAICLCFFKNIKYYSPLLKSSFVLNYMLRSLTGIYDKNFEYFRKRPEYKNTIVQMIDEANANKIINGDFTFHFKKHDISIDKLLQFLALRQNVMLLTTSQVKSVMCLLANTKTDNIKNSLALKYLDEKCAISVVKWNLELSLYIMDSWHMILGPKAFKKHYYSAVQSLWSRKVEKCTKQNVVQMLYFIGMSKSSPPFLMNILENKMENYNSNLSEEEIAIMFLSFFKTSTKIKSRLLLNLACKIAKSFAEKNDKFNLISILKCLRLSQYFDENLWAYLKEYIIKEYPTFNFVEVTNFLAVFAAQNVYEKNVFDNLENYSLSLLFKQEKVLQNENIDLKQHPSLLIRTKDIARFLWSLTSSGHNVKLETIDIIKKLLDIKIKHETKSEIHLLIDCLQSLALINVYPQSILKEILQPSMLKEISLSYRDKPRYQLYFILKSMKIDFPEFDYSIKNNFISILKPIPKILNNDITSRKGFQDILKILRQFFKDDLKCCYIIPHIMIAGIIVRRNNPNNINLNKTYNQECYNNILEKDIIRWLQKADNRIYTCLEILDPSVCLYNSFEPNGLMKAKIRHLKKLQFEIITLTSDEIQNLVKFPEDDKIKLENLFKKI